MASPVTNPTSGSHYAVTTTKGPPAEHRNGKIQGYYVGYKAYDSNLPYNYQTVTGGAESAVINDLKPRTAYSIIVQAFNRAGQSPSSHQIAVHPFASAISNVFYLSSSVLTVQSAGLPGPPTFFTSEVTCCSVLLTVTSKQNPTDGVTQYLVMYKNPEGGSWRSVYFPPHARKMQLRGLHRDTQYQVRLAAYNLEGRGQLSRPASFTTLRHGAVDASLCRSQLESGSTSRPLSGARGQTAAQSYAPISSKGLSLLTLHDSASSTASLVRARNHL
ncbi:hypothetical protein HPB48_008402 [Haemaphysalis longicornis]|uniref:Fibronectin type-III domain-containing protein n=1 Tax=Haemaphysalis longicornis TaxID=44386 RepID=A0A9J6H1U4_HAELO|nr:hypothetical protein HPB48_008402 [Haemaphysalis longicornis]